MKKIYENKQFIVLQKPKTNSFILYNKHKEFSCGHTHINNYNTVRWIMRLYTQRTIPYNMKSKYLLVSLLRISNDKDYSNQIEQLL